MATNHEEVAGGVSIADATAALVQSAEAQAGEEGTPEEDPNGGEGQVLDDAAGEAGNIEDEVADGADDDSQEDQDFYEGEEDEIHLVKIDGEEQEVSYGELVNGYQRQADYTRKTQEVANQRRALEGQSQQLQQQAVSYAQAYLNVANEVASFAPSDDDIKDAWGRDPVLAAELKEKQASALQQVERIKGLAVAIHRQQQDEQRKAMAEAGQKLPEFVPEWADQDIRKKEVVNVAEYLVQQGIAPQDVERSANPAAWAIARKAWLYDQLQNGTAAKEDKPSVPKIRKTRAPKPRLKGGRKRAASNKKAFDQNPSRGNAIAYMAQFEE